MFSRVAENFSVVNNGCHRERFSTMVDMVSNSLTRLGFFRIKYTYKYRRYINSIFLHSFLNTYFFFLISWYINQYNRIIKLNLKHRLLLSFFLLSHKLNLDIWLLILHTNIKFVLWLLTYSVQSVRNHHINFYFLY